MGLDEVNAGSTVKKTENGSVFGDFFVGCGPLDGAPAFHSSSPWLPLPEADRLLAVASLLKGGAPMSRVLSEFGSAVAETAAAINLPSLSTWWGALSTPHRELLMRRLALVP